MGADVSTDSLAPSAGRQKNCSSPNRKIPLKPQSSMSSSPTKVDPARHPSDARDDFRRSSTNSTESGGLRAVDMPDEEILQMYLNCKCST